LQGLTTIVSHHRAFAEHLLDLIEKLIHVHRIHLAVISERDYLPGTVDLYFVIAQKRSYQTKNNS